MVTVAGVVLVGVVGPVVLVSVRDAANVAERNRGQVVPLHARNLRRLVGSGRVDRRVDVEQDVTAQPQCLVRGNGVGNLVGRVAVGAAVHEGGLVGFVIADLVLEEDGPAVLAIPDDVPLLIVLDEETGGEDVVAVDDQTGVGRVTVQPVVPALPWSARQAQMWSMMVS